MSEKCENGQEPIHWETELFNKMGEVPPENVKYLIERLPPDNRKNFVTFDERKQYTILLLMQFDNNELNDMAHYFMKNKNRIVIGLHELGNAIIIARHYKELLKESSS